jgi:dTMP kinase
VIEPALAAGRTVVCDRYADSTVAYQGNGMGLALDTIHHLTALATGGLIPDITVCVDIDPDTGLERASSRGALNRLDKETLEFHQRVRKGYLALIAQQPDRWIAIDGGGTPEAVHEAVMCAVMARIKALGDAA